MQKHLIDPSSLEDSLLVSVRQLPKAVRDLTAIYICIDYPILLSWHDASKCNFEGSSSGDPKIVLYLILFLPDFYMHVMHG